MRACDDPKITHAVVTDCPEHGTGVYAWCTEFEAYSIRRSLKPCCHAVVERLNRDETGDFPIPAIATEAIGRLLGIS